jgi:hypothetical protein
MQSKNRFWIFLKCKVLKQHVWGIFKNGFYDRHPYYERQCTTCGMVQVLRPDWRWTDVKPTDWDYDETHNAK